MPDSAPEIHLTIHSRSATTTIMMLAFGLLAVAFGICLYLAHAIDLASIASRRGGPAEILVIILVPILTFSIHELVHGAWYKFFGGKIVFGAGMMLGLMPYLYTSAPNQSFRPWQMTIVGTSPFILLNLLTVIVCPFQPTWYLACVMVIVANTVGSCADIWLITNILRISRRFPRPVVRDTRDGFTIYNQAAAQK